MIGSIIQSRRWAKLSLTFVSIFLAVIVVLTGCSPSLAPPQPPSPSPMPETPRTGMFNFLVAEGVGETLFLGPNAIGDSQPIPLGKGGQLTVRLVADCWWEGSLSVWQALGGGTYQKVNVEPKVEAYAPDDYRVELAFKDAERGEYHIQVENKFPDRTMRALVNYWKQSETEVPASETTIVPEPKVWDKLTSEEHEEALGICYSLLRTRLEGLATSQAASNFVSSFFIHTTTCLSANGDSAGTLDDKEMFVHVPDNAWSFTIYGMFPTEETIEAEIEGVQFPLTAYRVPDRWSRATWLIFTDGRVIPWHDEYTADDLRDNAFNVEEDILKLNQGLELDYDWHR